MTDRRHITKLHKFVRPALLGMALFAASTACATALAAGANLPDMMAIDIGFIGKFAESGDLEDLRKEPYKAMQFRDRIARFTDPLAMSGRGAMAGMPVDVGPGALFYRKDLLDKTGVTEADLTNTWESFIESGKKLKAGSGAYLLASAVDIKDIYIRAGLKDGEGIHFDAKGQPLLGMPRFQKAFELAKAARTAGIDGKINAWTNEWSEGFKRDKIASQVMSAWLAGHLNNRLAPGSKGKWRSAQLPGGSFYGIPKKAQNKAAAWEFIKDQPIEYLGGQKARQQWMVAASKIAAYDVDKYDPVANEVVNAELEKVLDQDKDIKAAPADAQVTWANQKIMGHKP